MRTKLLMTSAIVALASSTAFGQTAEEPQGPQTPPPEMLGEPVGPNEPSAAVETAPIDPGSITGLIETQAEGQRLASDLLGSDVADGTGEAVGEVTDLILDDENKVIGAVISTGGFLGIGEHEVGVDIAQLQRDAEWDLYVIAWSREEIEAAPAFLTLAEQEAEQETELLRQQQMDQLEQQQAPADANQIQQ
jgi:sporulation protein YlmC with PRC-barrel domain